MDRSPGGLGAAAQRSFIGTEQRLSPRQNCDRMTLACVAHKSLEIFERCRLWQRILRLRRRFPREAGRSRANAPVLQGEFPQDTHRRTTHRHRLKLVLGKVALALQCGSRAWRAVSSVVVSI